MSRKKHRRVLSIKRYCFNHDVRKVAASDAFHSLDAEKCFAEIHGDKQMNAMLSE